MPRTPCCCGQSCCNRYPGDTLLLEVIAWANVGIYPDCVEVGEYVLERDDARVYLGFTGVWDLPVTGTGEPGCDDYEFILYCTGTTPDEWTLDIVMDGLQIYTDNPQPDRTCNLFYQPFRESDIAIDVSEMP